MVIYNSEIQRYDDRGDRMYLDTITITYPSDLTSLTHTFNIDGTQPKFYEFTSFSLNDPTCSVTNV